MIARLSLYLGVLLFVAAALSGFNIVLMLVAAAFIGAAFLANPIKCPKCRMTVPKGATVCGHCHAAL